MVENEIILTSFIQKAYIAMGEGELVQFERLLDEPDPSIYRWFTGAAPAGQEYRGTLLLQAIQEHTRSMHRKIEL